MKKWLKIVGLMVAVVAVWVVLLWLKDRLEFSQESNERLGLVAVNSLYSFEDLAQLDRQMVTLKEVTSEEVFNQLTLDYEERSLGTYLKFKGKPTHVKIIRSTEKYVLYSLDNENIAGNRVFLFTFEVENGKITEVWEAECYGF